MTPANGTAKTAAMAAKHYLSFGVLTVPNEPHGKRPWDFSTGRLRAGWEALRFDEPQIDELFPDGANIGINLGAPSGGMVDADYDTSQARRAAAFLMPPTDMVGGRESATNSHGFYKVDDPPAKASETLIDPVSRTLLLELRSTGGQTVVAPSVYGAEPEKGHPVPERFIWERHGAPGRVSADVLRTAFRATGAAALLALYWTNKIRHFAALPLAGGLRNAGWPEGPAVKFVRAVCAAANDEQVEDRVRCVRDTFAKPRDEEVTGWPTLIKLLGEHGRALVSQVTEWLDVPRKPPGGGRGSEGSPAAPPRYVPPPAYVPFPVECLPAPWDAFVREGAAALKCDAALVALPVLSVLAGAIGNSRRVHLGSEWFEPAIVWTCPIAESGGMKSAAANLSLDMVRARQKTLVKKYKDEIAAWKKTKRQEESSESATTAEDDEEKPKPKLKRVVVGDITIEKLAGLHDDNRRGLLVARDELSGWFRSFTRYKGTSGGSDDSNWLSMHRGEAIIYDRKTGDKTSVFVPHAATSITGGIQPDVLRKLAAQDLFASGMIARILFAMPPRTPKEWSDHGISDATRAEAEASLNALFELTTDTDDDGDLSPKVVKLGVESKKRLRQFVNRWGLTQFEAEGARAAALAKLEALPGRFALVHHTVSKVATLEDTDPIAPASLEAGIRLAEWFANEADRVYAIIGESALETEIRKLVELVNRLAARNEGRITVKILQRANQKKYRTADLAKADLERLVGLELGEWERPPERAEGGWTPTYFIPHTRPGVTGDSSYSRPDEDTPSGGDSRSDPRIVWPERSTGHSTVNTSQGVSCDAETAGRDEQGYEESPVTPERAPENGSDGLAPAAEARVTPPPVVITSATGVRTLADVLAEWNGPIGLDTETTGLDTLADRARLIQIAVGDEVHVIDVDALSVPATALEPLFAVLAGKELILHNAQFDLRFLQPRGFTPGRVFDTMLASRVLYAGERDEDNARVRHGLEHVVERELGARLDKGEQTSDWSGPLSPRQLAYAAADVAHLIPLAEALKRKLGAADLTATADGEMRALPGVAWAAPIHLDVGAWVGIAESAEAERARLAEEMDALAPDPAGLPGIESRNWDSPPQVKAAFAQLGITLASTDDDALAGIDHPLAERLREYRACAKRCGTYGRAWVEKHVSPGDCVLPSWNQLGAESGRMSCSDPNLQQIPRGSEYRRCFVAQPGCVLVKADYSQIELRIAAKVANEAVMIEAYRAGRDLHTLTAARVLDKPEPEVTKADRQLAKAINFGLLYGMGWKSLKAYAKANYGVELTDGQARAYRAAFFDTYPALREWHAATEAAVKKLFRKDATATHEVHTLGRRRRFLPVAKRDAEGKPYPNKTDALNTPVQGTGADGLKEAIALLWERRDECPTAVPVIFCHDEIVIEVREEDDTAAADWLRRCMVDAVAPLIDPVPVEVEVTVGRTWGG